MSQLGRQAWVGIVVMGIFPLFISNHAMAQSTNSFPANGNVGIGTTSPSYPLDVNGTIGIKGSPAFDRTTIATPSDGTYVIASGGRIRGEYVLSWIDSPNRTQTVHLMVNANSYDPGSVLQVLENHAYNGAAVMSNFRLLIAADNSTEYMVMDVGNRAGGTAVSVQYQGSALYGAAFGGSLAGNEVPIGVVGLASTEGGNVGIGTTNPQYRLSVNGTIQAKEVLVNTGWSDYVFAPDYKIRPLTEVAAFIKANHHLPDIPSEAEVKEKGVSLGGMQSKLLAKIEELTLQMIQLNEKNRVLEKRVAQITPTAVAKSGRNGGK